MQGLLINAYPWHNVAWLYDTVRPDQIEDKDDLWIKTWGTPLNENHHGGQSKKALLQEEEEGWVTAHMHEHPTSCTRTLHLVSNVLSVLVISTIFIASTFLTGRVNYLLTVAQISNYINTWVKFIHNFYLRMYDFCQFYVRINHTYRK